MMKEVHKELREKLEVASAQYKTAKESVASVVVEKDRLIKDNEEMKSLCEELMAMVEGGQPK